MSVLCNIQTQGTFIKHKHKFIKDCKDTKNILLFSKQYLQAVDTSTVISWLLSVCMHIVTKC
jgi:hypothetical protein